MLITPEPGSAAFTTTCGHAAGGRGGGRRRMRGCRSPPVKTEHHLFFVGWRRADVVEDDAQVSAKGLIPRCIWCVQEQNRKESTLFLADLLFYSYSSPSRS